MKIHIPVSSENKVKACTDCQKRFYNWKVLLTVGEPICINSGPPAEQDPVTGIVQPVDIKEFKSCRTERNDALACGIEGKYWEKTIEREDYGFY